MDCLIFWSNLPVMYMVFVSSAYLFCPCKFTFFFLYNCTEIRLTCWPWVCGQKITFNSHLKCENNLWNWKWLHCFQLSIASSFVMWGKKRQERVRVCTLDEIGTYWLNLQSCSFIFASWGQRIDSIGEIPWDLSLSFSKPWGILIMGKVSLPRCQHVTTHFVIHSFSKSGLVFGIH